MSKEAAVQSVKDKVEAPEIIAPVVEKSEPVTAQAVASKPKKQVATAAAVKKMSTKPKTAIKAVAAKPAKTDAAVQQAPARKAPAKELKNPSPAAKEKAAAAPKAEKESKAKKQAPKKPKLVRDSFTIPETDYALFAILKQRVLSAGVEVKKSEILRAAVLLLSKLDDVELIKAIGFVERIKTGRPKK